MSYRGKHIQQSNLPFVVRNEIKYYHFTRDLPPCSQWKEEGEDHINISLTSTSDLGRLLAPNFSIKFNHDKFGVMSSVTAVWAFVDNLTGMNAIKDSSIPLRFIIADSLWQRISQYPALKDALKEESRDFDFYVFNKQGFPHRPTVAYWYLEAVYCIKEALENGDEYPDFTSLNEGCDVDREAIYQTFISDYAPNRRKKAIRLTDETHKGLIRNVMEESRKMEFRKPKPRKELPAKVEETPTTQEEKHEDAEERLEQLVDRLVDSIPKEEVQEVDPVDLGNGITDTEIDKYPVETGNAPEDK